MVILKGSNKQCMMFNDIQCTVRDVCLRGLIAEKYRRRTKCVIIVCYPTKVLIKMHLGVCSC